MSLESVELERAVHAGGGEVVRVATEAHAGGGGGVVVEHLELLPLAAEVDAHVAARDGQVRAALVEAQLLDHVPLLQLDRLEVLQLAQIPKLDACVLRRRRKVITVLRERYRGDGSHVAGEVGHVALLLQVPNLDLRVLGTRAEDEAVGMELRGGEADAGGVANLGEQSAGADVGERPVLVRGGGQHVVAGRVQRQPRHRALVRPQDDRCL